jgi:hypothetical protein
MTYKEGSGGQWGKFSVPGCTAYKEICRRVIS